MLSRRTCNSEQFVDFDLRLVLCLDGCVGCSVGCHTTGVERTEGQLRTRFTDGLCSDDTDSLALLHHALSGEVTSVALHADTLLALASEDGTNFNTLNATCLNFGSNAIGDFLTTGNNEFVGLRIDDVMNRYTAQNALR